MQPQNISNNNGETIIQRVGFWLGIVLFTLLLAMPTPESTRQAVRGTFAGEIKADVARALEQRGASDAAPDSPVYLAEEQKTVEHRARVMMAAAAVTALVACWWITVAIPIPVTSLMPLALFPLVGVMPVKQAAIPYANSNVFLFMGGFIIALGIEKWGLHRRIALHIVRLVGTSRSTIVLGFMLASALLSMWISNTAATLMMLPIGMAIITAVSELTHEDDARRQANFSAALMLGIAYAASIGGVGTPIGTPPNISFRGQMTRLFPEAAEISFGQWMLVFIPLVLVFLPLTWLVLVKITCPVGKAKVRVGGEMIAQDLHKLGPMRRPKLVLGVFLMTALLWMTRSIPIGDVNYGWSGLIERWLTSEGRPAGLFHAKFINDATVALGMAVLLFMIPAGSRAISSEGRARRREYLMDWETALRLPWGILLLFGGGFSIAGGFRASGLSYWCGQLFAGLDIASPILVILCICLLMTFLTEITSNTATTEVMLPILAGVTVAMEVNPLLLMLPATISASCAFMLPVATPPNAIVFGSGYVQMGRMVRSGIILNLIGVVVVTTTFYFVARPILGIDISSLPAWAG